MSEFLIAPFVNAPPLTVAVLVRLVLAAVLGGVIAWMYRRTRPDAQILSSFPGTLVLLAVLIAMVTQVIGENLARAFGLVGALSIVRFRTVVRDTQDTAFVIFAVIVGMAVGANDPWVAVIGMVVVGVVAFLMRGRDAAEAVGPLPFVVRIRVALGTDIEELFRTTLGEHLATHRLRSIETARSGMLLEVTYDAALRTPDSAERLVKALNRLEGVQSVHVERRDPDPDDMR
jgi:uncharacterized membrane protein YhiD involved in acid resistance